jgi:phage tail sheath gpL-like
VVAEDRNKAIYQTACNSSTLASALTSVLASALATDPHRPIRKAIRHLRDNSLSSEPLRRSQPTFRQVGA